MRGEHVEADRPRRLSLLLGRTRRSATAAPADGSGTGASPATVPGCDLLPRDHPMPDQDSVRPAALPIPAVDPGGPKPATDTPNIAALAPRVDVPPSVMPRQLARQQDLARLEQIRRRRAERESAPEPATPAAGPWRPTAGPDAVEASLHSRFVLALRARQRHLVREAEGRRLQHVE
jgi:hypothetical protein